MSPEFQPKTYQLPGVTVEVHQPAGNSHYFANLEVDGNYPGDGKIAHNVGRKESLHWLEGIGKLILNNETHTLDRRTRITMNDGDFYILEGQGRAIVFVKDKQGGTTVIEDMPDFNS